MYSSSLQSEFIIIHTWLKLTVYFVTFSNEFPNETRLRAYGCLDLCSLANPTNQSLFLILLVNTKDNILLVKLQTQLP